MSSFFLHFLFRRPQRRGLQAKFGGFRHIVKTA